MGSMSAGLPSAWTTMITFVCAVIFDSRSAGSMLSDSSDSANTGSAPCITMELKQEYQLSAGRITSSPGPTPRAASAVVSAAVPDVTARANFVCIRAASSFSKVSTFIGGWLPEPYQRNGERFSRTSRELEQLFVVVVLRAGKARAERLGAHRLATVGGQYRGRWARAGESSRSSQERSSIHVGLLSP